ncbi:unnamed protein product [Linum trigynum]|uniref:Uncharacterized protein n=1 Tax=Linum trigynum TaxID=586398 RepID=A0AAV2FBQ2_9ROSI
MARLDTLSVTAAKDRLGLGVLWRTKGRQAGGSRRWGQTGRTRRVGPQGLIRGGRRSGRPRRNELNRDKPNMR